jgi:hypothetical protein
MSNMPVDEGMCKIKTLQNVKRPQTQMKLYVWGTGYIMVE